MDYYLRQQIDKHAHSPLLFISFLSWLLVSNCIFDLIVLKQIQQQSSSLMSIYVHLDVCVCLLWWNWWINKKNHISNEIPYLQHHSDTGIYEWTQEQQGYILSSFYIGYVLTHVPGGIIAERYGGKWTLSLGILSTAVFTVLTPLAVKVGM